MPIYDLGLDHVSLAFATTTVFTEVTQGVFEGDRIGIVGRNGDGKSTLLRLLAGRLEPDSGRVTRRGGLTFGMLDQRDPLDDSMTVRQAALEGRQDYEWAADPRSRDIVEALLGGIDLEARVGTLSGGQRRRADLARLLLRDWDILALDEPTNHLDIVTIHWLAEHLKSRWSSGQGALLLVTHDRWFLDEVCESMWEVHDGTIEPFEGGYSAYMLQRVERDRQADVREERRRNLARKELAWLTRGARARATKQKFHVKQARDLIADVPPMRDRLELRRMATARLGKQVVDLVDVTQIYPDGTSGGAPADAAAHGDDGSSPASAPASASGASGEVPVSSASTAPGTSKAASDVVPSPFAEPSVTASVTLTKDASSSAAASVPDTSAATTVTVTGRRVLDDVTWLIGPGDRIGIVGANGAGKSTLLRIIDGTLKPTAGRVTIGKTVRFAVLSQRLDELEKLAKYRISEVLSRYKPTYVVDGKEVPVGQLMERLGFSSAQLMTPIGDLSGGQKRRMQLLLILLDEPNVLIMDEPGNDLDTDMLAVMEDLLDSWPGTLVVVSHDRYLLERVTDDQYALVGGKVRHLPGGVDEYLRLVDAEAKGRGAEGSSGSSEPEASAKHGGADAHDAGGRDAAGTDDDDKEPKLSGKAFHDAKRRMAAIERRLERLEEDQASLEAEMAAHDPSDYVGLGKLNDELKSARKASSDLEAEWMELGEQVE